MLFALSIGTSLTKPHGFAWAAGPVELSWLEAFHSKMICASKRNSGCGWMVFIKLWTMKMKKIIF